ncbi:Ku protein, partial [Streptomyces sp. NPDC057546]
MPAQAPPNEFAGQEATSVGPSPRPAAQRELTEVLARTGYVGLCKIAIGRRERLAVLRPRHGVLVCQTLLWQDELR